MKDPDKLTLRLGLGFVLLVVLLVFIGICARNAKAQEVPAEQITVAEEDFPPGDDQIVPLSLDEPAPFSGQLFSEDTAIRWGFRLQRLRLRLDADVAREREICAARTDLWETKFNLNQERYDFQLGLLRTALADSQKSSEDLANQLAEASDTPWYETWEFGLVVGVVGTVVVGVLSAVLVYELKN